MINEDNVLSWDDCIPIKKWLLLSTIVIFFLSTASYIFVAMVNFIYLRLGSTTDDGIVSVDGTTTLIFVIVAIVVCIIIIILTIFFSKKIGFFITT